MNVQNLIAKGVMSAPKEEKGKLIKGASMNFNCPPLCVKCNTVHKLEDECAPLVDFGILDMD